MTEARLKSLSLIILILFILIVLPAQAQPVINPSSPSDIPEGLQEVFQYWFGITGPSGSPGPAGEMNMTQNLTANMTAGPQGIQGIQGPEGQMNLTVGPQGPPGTANMTVGPPGLAATTVVNDTFDGAPGTPADVTNIGTPSAAQLDFTIPAGVNGTPGAPGAPGAPGTTSHNLLLNLSLDDHLQYFLDNGIRIFTGKVDHGAWNVSNVTTNIAVPMDAVNVSIFNQNVTATNSTMKTYVDNVNTTMRNNVSMKFAPLVSEKVPTVNLGGAGADATKYLRGDQTWATGGSNPTAGTTTLIVSDFYDATQPNSTIPGLSGISISAGTIGTVATTANHPGVIYMRDSTTIGGGYRFGCLGTQLIGGGETFEVVFQPVGVRSGQSVQMGWSDTAAAGTAPVDGVWLNISATGAAITLRGNVSSNSVRNGTSTTYVPTTATWYHGCITVNSDATLVTYTLSSEAGALLWSASVPTPIPTGAGRDTSPCIIVAQSSTDAAADILRLDYTRWATTKALQR